MGRRTATLWGGAILINLGVARAERIGIHLRTRALILIENRLRHDRD